MYIYMPFRFSGLPVISKGSRVLKCIYNTRNISVNHLQCAHNMRDISNTISVPHAIDCSVGRSAQISKSKLATFRNRRTAGIRVKTLLVPHGVELKCFFRSVKKTSIILLLHVKSSGDGFLYCRIYEMRAHRKGNMRFSIIHTVARMNYLKQQQGELSISNASGVSDRYSIGNL